MFDILNQCLHSCETPCTAKGSVIAQTGECFLSSFIASAREQIFTSHTFNGPVLLPVRDLALLSTGFSGISNRFLKYCFSIYEYNKVCS